MVLKTSMWAKRRYVRFKRWQPKAGGWADWALRRRSAAGALKRQKEREAQGCAAEAQWPAMRALSPDPPLTPPETWADREGRANRRPDGQLTSARPSLIGPLQQRLPERRPFFL